MKLTFVFLIIIQFSAFAQLDFFKEINKKDFLISKTEIISILNRTSKVKFEEINRDYIQLSNYNYRGILFENFTISISNDTLGYFNISIRDSVDPKKTFEIVKGFLVNTFGEGQNMKLHPAHSLLVDYGWTIKRGLQYYSLHILIEKEKPDYIGIGFINFARSFNNIIKQNDE